MTIYEIDAQVAAAFGRAVDPETGEIINEKAAEELDKLQISRDEKIEAIGIAYKNMKAERDGVKGEMDNLAKRYRAADRGMESCKWLAQYALNGEKFKTSKVAFSYRRSTAVEVTNIDLLPDQFVKVEKTANKTALKELLSKGGEVPGAHLEEHMSIQIK